MAKPKAIVDRIHRLSPIEKAKRSKSRAARRVIRVEFLHPENEPVFLDATDTAGQTRAWILRSLHEDLEPAYVEYDPNTRFIVKLNCPFRSKIGQITELVDQAYVELIESSRHFLKTGQKDFKSLLGTLYEAQRKGIVVIVTDDGRTHQILDVRPDPFFFRPSVVAPPPTAPPLCTPPAITSTQAQSLFDFVNGVSCPPSLPSSPCIPFQYASSFCNSRAHEMCRLIIAQGFEPCKLWAYSTGNLVVATPNHPDCEVRWGYHVAPTVGVSARRRVDVFVLDPSLFAAPVPQATWFARLGDPAATTVVTDASVFLRRSNGDLVYEDPSYPYAKTIAGLRSARRRLAEQSLEHGPPPYSHCMTLSAGSTARTRLAASA